MENNNDFIILSGNSNLQLAKDVCGILKVELGRAFVDKFSDKEIQIEINQNVRKKDVYVIQSTSEPANDHYMELFIFADAIKRASARSMTAVIPYFGYARQDRKAKPRTPITAKLMADLLAAVGYSRIITFDLHAGQIQGFFDIPVDNLYARKIFLDYIQKNCTKKAEEVVIVAPDAGGVPRAREYAKALTADLAIIDKEREMPGKIKSMSIIGEVKDKIAIVVDDLIDTAGTLTKGAELLIERGARKVIAIATHPVLSGPAIRKINESAIERIFVTDTISLGSKEVCQKIQVLSIANLLAESISRCQLGESINDLF